MATYNRSELLPYSIGSIMRRQRVSRIGSRSSSAMPAPTTPSGSWATSRPNNHGVELARAATARSSSRAMTVGRIRLRTAAAHRHPARRLACHREYRGGQRPSDQCRQPALRSFPARPLAPRAGERRNSRRALEIRAVTALTWKASCVYSALLRRVLQARRALSCPSASWARTLKYP